MLRFIDDIITFDYSYCQQCGACEAVCPKQAISFRRLADGTHQVVVDDEKCIRCKRCVNVCPANKREGFDGYFNGFEGKRYFLGYNKDNAIRRASSSGGVCKTIVIESLKNGLVDGVSPDEGRSLSAGLKRRLRGTSSTIETYQNEEGFTFYRVTRS